MRVIVTDDDGNEMFNICPRYDQTSNCLFPGPKEATTVATCLTRALAFLMPALPGEPEPEMDARIVDAVDATEPAKPERPAYLRLVETASNDG